METCTRGGWNFGTSSCDQVITISAFRVAKKNGKEVFVHGDQNGRIVSSQEEATSLGLLHGYLQPYNRNLGEFLRTKRWSRATGQRYVESKRYPELTKLHFEHGDHLGEAQILKKKQRAELIKHLPVGKMALIQLNKNFIPVKFLQTVKDRAEAFTLLKGMKLSYLVDLVMRTRTGARWVPLCGE